MKLIVLPGKYSICRLAAIPPVEAAEFLSLTVTSDEVSLVCRDYEVPKDAREVESDWRALKIEGILDFALVGIIAGISQVLAQKAISIFAVSTFNTDYILVKENRLDAALEVLQVAGYEVQNYS